MSLLAQLGAFDVGAVVPPRQGTGAPLDRRTSAPSAAPYMPAGGGFGPAGANMVPTPGFNPAAGYPPMAGTYPGQYWPGGSPQDYAIQAAQQAIRDRQAFVATQLTPIAPGVPRQGWRREPLGLPSFVFTATSGTLLQQQTSPQKPFKGGRLVISIARTGATATGLITVNSLVVGSRNVLVSSNPVPAEMFGQQATDTILEIDEMIPGINLVLQLSTSLAPTAPDTIVVSAGIVGLSWS